MSLLTAMLSHGCKRGKENRYKILNAGTWQSKDGRCDSMAAVVVQENLQGGNQWHEALYIYKLK